ncbi:MAG: hypothetical protein HY700_21790 [Gemmatimonadetes bacterium]|nr:hypothetical protein [Gemmatimonadota bacterium]
MSLRRCLIPFAVFASATAATLSCGGPAPTSVDLQTPAFRRVGKLTSTSTSSSDKRSGLVKCSQTYDSVTKVIGPSGDTLQVGNHIFWVDSGVLGDTVRITAVAPADTVRWVRFQPDGLLFPPSPLDLSYGLSAGAVLYTNYKDCGVPTADTLRVAQVDDSKGILEYLQTWSKVKKNAWSEANQFVVGQVPHFSNYAIAF